MEARRERRKRLAQRESLQKKEALRKHTINVNLKEEKEDTTVLKAPELDAENNPMPENLTLSMGKNISKSMNVDISRTLSQRPKVIHSPPRRPPPSRHKNQNPLSQSVSSFPYSSEGSLSFQQQRLSSSSFGQPRSSNPVMDLSSSWSLSDSHRTTDMIQEWKEQQHLWKNNHLNGNFHELKTTPGAMIERELSSASEFIPITIQQHQDDTHHRHVNEAATLSIQDKETKILDLKKELILAEVQLVKCKESLDGERKMKESQIQEIASRVVEIENLRNKCMDVEQQRDDFKRQVDQLHLEYSKKEQNYQQQLQDRERELEQFKARAQPGSGSNDLNSNTKPILSPPTPLLPSSSTMMMARPRTPENAYSPQLHELKSSISQIQAQIEKQEQQSQISSMNSAFEQQLSALREETALIRHFMVSPSSLISAEKKDEQYSVPPSSSPPPPPPQQRQQQDISYHSFSTPPRPPRRLNHAQPQGVANASAIAHPAITTDSNTALATTMKDPAMESKTKNDMKTHLDHPSSIFPECMIGNSKENYEYPPPPPYSTPPRLKKSYDTGSLKELLMHSPTPASSSQNQHSMRNTHTGDRTSKATLRTTTATSSSSSSSITGSKTTMTPSTFISSSAAHHRNPSESTFAPIGSQRLIQNITSQHEQELDQDLTSLSYEKSQLITELTKYSRPKTASTIKRKHFIEDRLVTLDKEISHRRAEKRHLVQNRSINFY